MLNRLRSAIACSVDSSSSSNQFTTTKILIWAVWGIYVSYLLLSDLPPGPSLLHTPPATWQEAINLSLNFWFVMPALLPHLAPTLHPALEGLFNIVVAWGLLFWAFWIDGRHQRLPIAPFLIGTALLTNVFYLPWLALRTPNTKPVKEPLTLMEKIAESPIVPGLLAGMFSIAVAWAIAARPEFGDLPTRQAELVKIVCSDRLAYSFVVDLFVFWGFEAWLVKDDMARRQAHNEILLWIVRLVPFWGLVIYLMTRPTLSIEGD